MKSVLGDLIDEMSSLVYIMAWHKTGDKLLSKPLMTLFIDIPIQHWGEMHQ